MSLKHILVSVVVTLAVIWIVAQSPFAGTFGLAS